MINNLLILTNMYPSDLNQKGIFVKELVLSLKKYCRTSPLVFNIDEQIDSKLKYILSIKRLYKFIRTNECKIINIHFGLSFIPLFILYPYIFLKKIKLVLTLHGSDLMGGRFVNLISNTAIMLSHSAIIVSQKMKGHVWKVNHHKLKVIPCGVDGMFKYANREGWDKNKKLNIIFPSNPSRPEKNYYLFKQLVLSLENQGIDVNEIIFDNLDRKQILEHLTSSNVLFLSSLREGSPQVVKEAVLTGLPVISTDVGDVRDIISGIPYHKVIISSNVIDITNWIINDFDGGSIDKKIVDSKYSIYSNEIILKRVLDIYKQVLKE
ncbi:glycosyltransferase [Aliivibrio fischeri]|uniref:glycosyltransferase n=1 Tax=Aliivibrio fischeri TaxID=668 RepID=UPI0012DA5C16|nr:glycosyltransferase [Aliivibrio fischeri]MUK65330.1 glycosyltransferase [Aliivibrio fischeri]